MKQVLSSFQKATKVFVAAGILILFAGCASNRRSAEAVKPGSGIAEYRQLVSTSRQAIENVLQSLASVSAQSNQVSPDALALFSTRLSNLQSESVLLRARAKVILDRGDQYFNNWQEHLASIEDKRVRALVDKNRPQLQQVFHEIKAGSQQTREAFQPFMDSVRHLRNALEKDPASLSGAANQNLIKVSRDGGNQVLKALDGIQHELDSMTALITPSA